MSYFTDEETESQSAIQTCSRGSLMTGFPYRLSSGLCTWDRHRRGHLGFLMYNKNKDLGGSHDGHVRSPFFPASRRSEATHGAYTLLLSNTSSECGRQGQAPAQSGSDRTPSSGDPEGRSPISGWRRERLGSSHPGVLIVSSRAPKGSSQFPLKRNLCPIRPGPCSPGALQKRRLYLQKALGPAVSC